MWFPVLIPIFCALSPVVSATAQPAHAGSGLATTHPTCYTGIAWFMCCDNWKGKKGSTASERAVEMSHKRILNERLYGGYGCNARTARVGTLKRVQYEVVCEEPAEMVCCRVGKNGLKKSVKETEDPVCQVVEEYAPNEKGLAGLDGYNEVKSEVYQGMKETFNPYMDVERE